MRKRNLAWKGDRLYLGRVGVGCVFRGQFVHRDDPPVWFAACLLPGVLGEKNSVRVKNAAAAKIAVVQMVEAWLVEAWLVEATTRG